MCDPEHIDRDVKRVDEHITLLDALEQWTLTDARSRCR